MLIKWSTLQAEESINKYKKFLELFLLLREEQEEKIFLRELDFSLDVLINGRGNVRGTEATPLAILNIGYDGTVSTFSPELLSMKDQEWGDFIFGNVNNNSVEELLQNPKFLKVFSEIRKGIAKCKASCDYFSVCGGGSPSNKLYENGTFNTTETMSCRFRIKTLTDATLEFLEQKHNL